MKSIISYERLNPSTINGEQLRVTITYSSFIKDEIDAIESFYKKEVGTMRIDNSGGDE